MTIAHCKPTIFHSCFILFIPGLLLSFSFVILGSSLRGSSLDQWLVIHFIGHYLHTLGMHYLYKWSVVLTNPFCLRYPLSIWWVFCSDSGAVSIYTWRGTVPPPDISREEGLRTGLQSQEVFPMSDLLVALGIAFGSTLQSIGLK